MEQNIEQNKQKTLQFAIISIVLILTLLIGIVVYYNSLVENLQESTCKTLDEVMQQEKHNFSKSLNADKAALIGYSEVLSITDMNEDNLIVALSSIVSSTDFEYVFFADLNGNAINNLGEQIDCSDRDYFHTAIAGETVISEPVKSKIRDAYVIAVATPFMHNGQIEGALIGTFNTEKLNNLFTPSFDGYGYSYIATNTGELIARTESTYVQAKTGNLFSLYKTADFFKHDSYETMLYNLTNNKGGHTQYKVGSEERLMHYDKLAINGWNIFVVVSPAGVSETVNKIIKNAVLLTTGLVGTFILLLGYNLFSKKQFTEELDKMAYVDDVTGCSSFGKFKLDAGALIKNRKDINYILIKQDIDKFRLINEIYTLAVGDRILKAAADALDTALDNELDAFARIHADEFILLIGFRSDDGFLEKKERFEHTFESACIKLLDSKISLSRGRYLLQDEDVDFGIAYEKANFAHRMAKESGVIELDYDGKVKDRAIFEKDIERRMEDALEREEYKLFLQPKYHLYNEKIAGAEALVRWSAEDKSLIYPNDFIPVFERNGFIIRLDMYMFKKTCQKLREWIDAGITPISISVNFSRRHLSNPTFIDELSTIADQYEIPHNLLEIELTETAMLENLSVLEEVLKRIHLAGFTLSMDDFGTGYSSLSLLKNICVDVIKIDKSFFDESKDLNRAKTIISSVMDMAVKLNIHTVAEGVETKIHIDLLRELGCEIVQGYYYDAPMPAAQLEIKLLRSSFTQE